ncbi:MAG: DsbA family protein [bacterium]|nr:DsbA family protein [bacterium]
MAEHSSLVRLQEEYHIELDWRGFVLHPEIPVGGMPIKDYFGAARVAGFTEHLAQACRSAGLEPIAPQEILPNTGRALALAEVARDQGRLMQFREAAMLGYWRQSRSLEADEDLLYFLEAAGLDAPSALALGAQEEYRLRVEGMAQLARLDGVEAIPTFVFAQGPRIVGAQPYVAIERAALAAGATPK